MYNSMIFPATVDEFMEEYKVVDSEHIYSNGMEMVPIFRMKQWFEHEANHNAEPGKMVDDTVSRQAAMERLMAQNVIMDGSEYHNGFNAGVNRAQEVIRNLPPVQPNHNAEVSKMVDDLISRQAATTIPVMPKEHRHYQTNNLDDAYEQGWNDLQECIENLPSAQPERTCVNCGRTANNGGWYADGRTRCPIEEHYALPKDGYCHLWEKRNVTDDNYPERREE